jgi:succinyl-diaminopimelate desuccinylase
MPTTRGPGRHRPVADRRSDPRFAWYASSADVDTVMIDGRPRVRIVKLVGADVAASISEGAPPRQRYGTRPSVSVRGRAGNGLIAPRKWEFGMTPHRDALLSWIDRDRDLLVQFLSDFVAKPSPNPPGDTKAAAAFLHDTLQAQGTPVEYRTAKPDWPNVVGSFDCGDKGRHLVLNGHIDVFPAGPRDAWSRDPWSGAIADDKIHGRGVVDMKCGTAASVWTYIYLHRLRDRLKGKLTLTCVSDEETGGTWGAKWLVDTFPAEFRGDCVLNGEPSTPGTLRFAEKGTLRVVFEIATPGAHAAYTHLSKNAIRIASDLVRDLYGLENLPVTQSEDLRRAIESGRAAMDRALGDGAGRILDRVTVSVGVIQGGLKINVLPGQCRLEVDIRLPVGLSHAAIMAELKNIAARYAEVKLTPVWTHSAEPSTCDPKHPMVGILQRAVAGLGYPKPAPVVSLGASDCKHWRHRNVPAYVYGCTPNNMAKPDEWVGVEEYLHVLRSHVLAAASYLA